MLICSILLQLKKTKISIETKAQKPKSPGNKKSPKGKVPKAVAKQTTDIVQLNKVRKQDFKKMKKQRRRAGNN